jgi:hypothetical protein
MDLAKIAGAAVVFFEVLSYKRAVAGKPALEMI